MNRRIVLALLLAGCAAGAHADIHNLTRLQQQVNAPPVGVWIDLIATSKAGRFIDADVQVNGNGTCGEVRVLVDGQQAWYFDHHHQYSRRSLPGAPVQQMQRFDTGYLIEEARVQPPEPVHFSTLQVQFRGMPGCAAPGVVFARTTSDTF